MQKKRVAIIGFGRSGGDIHGAFFASARNEWFEVVAVVDELEVRRERAKAQFGCDVYADYHEILDRKDIDLVVNATYSHHHFPVALDFLKHGFNIVTEKPFSVHAEQCDQLIAAAKESGASLCVFQQSHFAPYYQEIRRIIDSGVLGRIAEIKIQFSGYSRRWDWQCSTAYGGGCLRNTGPHPMEQAINFFDDDTPPSVIAFMDKMNSWGDAEDFVKILLSAPGKPLIEVEISSCNAYAEDNYLIQGEYGTLKATHQSIDCKYLDPVTLPKHELIMESLQGEGGKPAYCGEKREWNEIHMTMEGDAFGAAVMGYYSNVYDHLTTGAPLVIRPEKIRQVIAIMDEAHRQNPQFGD